MDAYLDGEAAAEVVGKARRHLESCGECQTAVERRRRLDRAVRLYEAPRAPTTLSGRVLAQAAARSGNRMASIGRKRRWAPNWSRAFHPGRLAAAAVVLVGLAIGMQMSRQTWRQSETTTASNVDVSDNPSLVYDLRPSADGSTDSLAYAYYSLASSAGSDLED